jgi:hypothetical protein
LPYKYSLKRFILSFIAIPGKKVLPAIQNSMIGCKLGQYVLYLALQHLSLIVGKVLNEGYQWVFKVLQILIPLIGFVLPD